MATDENMEKIIDRFKRALEAAREAKSCGEISVVVKVHQGGIRYASVTAGQQVV